METVMRNEMKWEAVPLDDLTEDETPITYGVVKPGEEGDILFVRGGDIASGRILINQLRTIKVHVSKQYRRTLLRGGEILVSLVGNPGQVAIVPPELAGANIARQVGLVRLKLGVNARFVSYFLQSCEGQAAFGAQSLGSVQQVINLRDLKTVKVPLPPLAEQKAIAAVLGALDDKIELNRRMNTTLEAMARALFQSWFVDFDPVRAKLDGRTLTGLDSATAALFPESFQDSQLGPIPNGWNIRTIEEATSLIIDYRGRTPKKMGSDWSPTGIPAISAKNVKAGRLVRPETFNFVNEELYERWMKDKLALGDILMTSEAPLGELYYLALNARFCLSQRIFAMRANPVVCEPAYLYYWLESPRCQTDIINRGTGTTVEGIRQSELRKVSVLLPPPSIQKAAAKFLAAWTEQIHRNEEQTLTLSTLRDSLLPKLLSGELSVSDIRPNT
jgi:type I restriction enzyme S subunit